MMRFIHFLLFFISFTLEVRVKANPDLNLHEISSEKVIFLKGFVHLQNEKLQQIDTVYGTLYVDHADVWLITKDDKITIRSISGKVNVQARDGQKITLDNGFQVTLGAVTEEGKSWLEIPRPIDLEDHLKFWKNDFKGSKEEFKNQAAAFKENWKRAVELSAQIYQKNANRHLASIAEEEEQKKERARVEIIKKNTIRKTFYQKVFER
ncbi:MAG TPA: hypothetical protein PLJ21_02785 [Pseudobdellovibrionaceae bacterium]|nr:hypothetical protein [Pseudobdellovibrionaceae bacterium]